MNRLWAAEYWNEIIIIYLLFHYWFLLQKKKVKWLTLLIKFKCYSKILKNNQWNIRSLFSKCLFMLFYYESLILIKLFYFIKSNCLVDLLKGSNIVITTFNEMILKTHIEYNWHLRKKGIFMYFKWFKIFTLFLQTNTSEYRMFWNKLCS